MLRRVLCPEKGSVFPRKQMSLSYTFQIAVLCLFEQSRTVGSHRTDMDSILVRDKNMANGLRGNSKLPHSFGKAVVVITRIDHNGRIPLSVEKDIPSHSRAQATLSSIQPVFSGLDISVPWYSRLIAFF